MDDETKLGATEAARELSLTSLAAVWKMCSTLQAPGALCRSASQDGVPEIPGDHHSEFREQFVARHPDVLLPPHREPHRKLVERIQRATWFTVPSLSTRWVRCGLGVNRSFRSLGSPRRLDQPVQAASETQVIDKLHAFFVALVYLNICEFTTGAGPLKYLAELEEWRHENRGLALLIKGRLSRLFPRLCWKC